MSEENQHRPYQMVRGFPFPGPYPTHFKLKYCEDAMDLEPEDGDLIIASYPKTGTTWVQYILLQIRSKGELFPPFDDVTHKIIPYIEMVGLENVYSQGKPRFYKHHIAYDFVKKNDKAKVVYTYRHPEDTVVSYWHFMKNLNSHFPQEFDEFFDNFVVGNQSYGSYFKHLLSFYEHRNDSNLLMVSYEKLHANRKEEILRIAKFLGEEHYQNLIEDDELLQKIIKHTSFDYMKKNLYLTNTDAVTDENKTDDNNKVNFFRKGIVGDGKATLSAEQRRRMKDAAKKMLEGTFFLEEWYPGGKLD